MGITCNRNFYIARHLHWRRGCARKPLCLRHDVVVRLEEGLIKIRAFLKFHVPRTEPEKCLELELTYDQVLYVICISLLTLNPDLEQNVCILSKTVKGLL